MSDGMKKKRKPKRPCFDNSEAVIQVIMFFFLAVAFIAFYIFVVGAMMDTVTDVHNNLTQSGAIPLSQDRQDSLGFLQGAFSSLPIIAFVLTIVVALIMAMATRNQTI